MRKNKKIKYSDPTYNLFKNRHPLSPQTYVIDNYTNTKTNVCAHTLSHCVLFAAVIRGVTSRQVEVTIMGLSYFCSSLTSSLCSDISPSSSVAITFFFQLSQNRALVAGRCSKHFHSLQIILPSHMLLFVPSLSHTQSLI